METQTLKKDYPCPYCNATFIDKMLLDMHLPRFHRLAIDPNCEKLTRGHRGNHRAVIFWEDE